MPKKSSKSDLEEDWTTCTFCGESIKTRNFERHLERVHDDLDDDELEDALLEVKPKSRPGDRKRAELKKKADLKKHKKKNKALFLGLFFSVTMILLAYFVLAGNWGKESDDIKISLSEVDDGQAHFYTYNANGVQVEYFVLKSSDGVVRAAFDACDVCYEEKKGYHQEGDLMVCNNCGQTFASVKINEERGGCNPAPLERKVEGDYLIIKTKDLEYGEYYFK